MVEQDNKGVNRCPKCGASEIEYNIKKEKLVCNYCHSEFDLQKVENEQISSLQGVNITEGSKAITNDNDLVVLKCDNCGAEVVINTVDNRFRCHWCHSILSINSKIGNGAVPDVVLPFKIDKEEAKKRINDFEHGRSFFADKTFKKEFKLDNIIGVYFPYLLIDCYGHAKFNGEAGHVADSYSKVVGKDRDGDEERKTFYDIDLYEVERDFDIIIDDFEIESSKDKINKFNKEKTTNVINSIMPFDTENCVEYKSNYLVGFNSEKRDLNIIDLQEKIDKSLRDVVRHSINNDLKFYDAGVSWKNENIYFKGQKIVSAYLPVWLYSYQDRKKIIHYVAVNARTGETMGSVPLNKFRLSFLCVSVFLLLLSIPFITMFILHFISDRGLILSVPLFLLSFLMGLAFSITLLLVVLSDYRNKSARHKYENDTKYSISNLTRNDVKKKTLYEESFSTIYGVNNKRLEGERIITK